jgi:DNA-binding winged helix-turn-helix (wHTH) protein/Flp pilus assembly protein TadD
MHAVKDLVFEFGDFLLAPKERLLAHRGSPISLTPKAFDLLVALVRRAGHLVLKEELLREVWPETIVEEVNLSVNISALRKALASEGATNEAIQTVPTRGYRFVTPVMARSAAVTPALPQDLSRQVGIPVAARETGQLTRPATDNADAYRAYLQGRHSWSQRSEAGLTRAIEHFERAIEIDPRFAAAYAGLGDSYATLGYLSYLSPGSSFPAARRSAAKALELDASLADPHATLGFVKLYFEWDWVGAEVEFQRAIELDPSYAAAHEWYSIFLLAAGRPAEAFREIQLARRLDPLSLPVNTDLGFHYYYTRQYAEAVKQLEFVLNLSRDFPPAHLWLGRTYQELGRFDDAISEFRHVEEMIHEWPISIAARGYITGVAGRIDEARNILAEMEALAGRKFVTSYGIALVQAGLGQSDAAFASLNRAFDERSNWLVWLRLDPRWKGMRSDPRFAELVGRMGFPQ